MPRPRTMRRRNLLSLLTAFGLVAVLAACGEGDTEVETGGTTPESTLPPLEGYAAHQLEAARIRWNAAGIDSYEMTWSRHGAWLGESGGSRVIDGEVVESWRNASTEAGTVTSVPGDDPTGASTTIPRPEPPGTTLPGDAPTTPAPDGAPMSTAEGGPGLPGEVPSGPTTTHFGEDPDGASGGDPGATPDADRGNGFDTVEGLFGVIQHAIDEDADEVDVTYDEATGRPERIDIDWMTNADDDEVGITVDSFTVLEGDGHPVTPEPSITLAPTTGTSQEPSVQAVGSAQLTEHHPCGTGFAVGNPEQTVALILIWQPDDRPTTEVQRPDAEPVTLPGGGWEGDLLVGENLFSSWCDDVFGPGTPIREVTDAWSVTGGVLDLTAAPTPNNTCGSGAPVEGTVTGLEVEASDGTTIGFADLALVNEAWGCVPG